MRHFSSSHVLAAGLVAGLALGFPAAAQQSLPPDHPPVPQDRVPPDPLPAPPQARDAAPGQAREGAPSLDELLERLKQAKRPEQAAAISREIESRWMTSGSDTIDLLMTRALTAVKAKETGIALDLLDAIVTLKPDYVEGWNKRATIHYTRKDIGKSIADIEMTLRLEPRHYGALYGLATLMKDLGRKDKALEAYRRVLAVNPHMPNVEKDIRELTIDVEGREL
jgi:tetratricopeptide (TPR) repeat protein